MKTNYQMLMELKEFIPFRQGILNNTEVTMLKAVLRLDERSDVELQNLRDFVVMYYSMKVDNANLTPKDRMTQMDIMSGICGVIDNEKWNRGMEV